MLAGCQQPPQDTKPHAIVEEATLSPTLSPTEVPVTVMATATLGTTATPPPTTVVPFISTPVGDGEREQILWLYETNNNCQLPCWWGIVPGQTEWQVAEDFLNRFDKNIYRASSPPEGMYYSVSIPLPLEIFIEEQTELSVLAQNNIIEIIDTRVSIGDTPPGYLTQYELSVFLTTYGQPSEVWLSTHSSPFEHDELPFSVALLYRDQGIVALYSDNGIKQGDMIHGCPQHNPATALSLWSPAQNITLEGVISGFAVFNRDFLPLEESTEINAVTFYEVFKVPDNTTCLETPANLWSP